MSIMKQIISKIITLIVLSLAAGTLYFIGNKIINVVWHVDNHLNAYMSRLSFSNCLGLSFVICFFSYGLYSMVCMIGNVHKNAQSKIFVSVFSFILTLCVFSMLSPYGTMWRNVYVVKNIIVFLIIALITPLIEKKYLKQS